MLGVLAGLLVLACCSATVSVPDPSPTDGDQVVCSSLMAQLPQRVHGQRRRTVTPGKFGAAWGQPPITLRCGVSKPAALTQASPCFDVDGVGWFAQQTSAGYVFTTIGRRTYVEVGVPSSYAPEADALVDVAAPLTRADPLLRGCV